MANLGKSRGGFFSVLFLVLVSASCVLGTTLASDGTGITATATSAAPTESASTIGSGTETSPPKEEKDGLETSDLISLVIGIVTLGSTFLLSTAPALEAILNIKALRKLHAQAKANVQPSTQGNTQPTNTPGNSPTTATGQAKASTP